jgi:predicted CXXCH cytochrome family protein
MTNKTSLHTKREVHGLRRSMTIVVLVVVALALMAVPAFAEGYNQVTGNYNATNTTQAYPNNAGLYVRTPFEATTQTATFKGPHGDYTTTTNKCQDCHSTHYATGSYMLLRANDRENACTFCHAGGGGSATNIQMDNAYNGTGVIGESTRGLGVGHTLGYKGNAPADINPAFSDTEGFACFDCHSPHGNSARVLTTFANPGRAVFEADSTGLGHTWVTNVGSAAPATQAVGFIKTVNGLSFTLASDPTYGKYFDLTENDGLAGTIATVGIWGLAPVEGNFVVRTSGTSWKAAVKPVWGTGRFLLLKNPDNEMVGGATMSDVTTSGMTGTTYNTADNGLNKLSIDWVNPLGPGDAAYGGNQDRSKYLSQVLPLGTGGSAFPTAKFGILSVSEFCTDCHDGTAGSSVQPANVWLPDANNAATGTYKVVYSHDAQPRH